MGNTVGFQAADNPRDRLVAGADHGCQIAARHRQFDRLRTVGEPMAVATDQDKQEVDELMAVRKRRLAKHRVMRVLQRIDRAFEKAQAEERRIGRQ